MRKQRLPQHFRYIIPVIDVLKELGGSGRAGEVVDLVVEKLGIPEDELNVTISSGQSRIKNQIQWARFMLVKAGLLESSERGVWSLTEKGMRAQLNNDDLAKLNNLRKRLQKEYLKQKQVGEKDEEKEVSDDEILDEDVVQGNYQTALLNVLKELPPAGFERICQRLLRESGFEQVSVIGRTGDGGIDGVGILQVNPFVSFKVIFQCKRFKGTLGAPIVRDFRGAMMGRADKGIIMTTGSFTTDAKREARRDGVTPIELVDGEKLVQMFEMYELGLKPVRTFELDCKFFEEFK
ncbi:Restriction endonuclease [uncultured Desulfobacterium sp.]|uniref:Restriction endonuclease n=1 Tax=uncultured Desulfobacterium sp. TaxID=201089 RepID=A0A445MT99_9BACT|nr:Restriction endonuclease [uncultured Desulfobacterium sp.]